MNKNLDISDRMAPRLRADAEAELGSAPQMKATCRAPEELLHDLQVHEIELEMQNETLRQAQIALEESRDRYADLYDFSPVAYLTLTREATIAEINLTGAALLGEERGKLLKRRFATFVAEADRDRLHRLFMGAIEHASRQSGELTLRCADGAIIEARLDCLRVKPVDGPPVVRIVVTDIGEHKRAADDKARRIAELGALNARLADAQSQLLQAEKMAAVGLLAAGMAHEINNPLGYINSNLHTLRNYVDGLLRLVDAYRAAAETGAPENAALLTADRLAAEFDLDYVRTDAKSLLAESQDGIERVKHVVGNLKVFSHVGEAEWQTADVHACLESTISVVGNEMATKVDLVREYGDLPEIDCLPFQLNQVFMNLLTNAAQAIAEHGTITLRTGRAADSVWIEVEDNGIGIAAEDLERIFEPFFTTKPVGTGTGLGLTLAYGIVRRHGGHIDVRSTPGTGTVFRVTLPIHPQAAAAVSSSCAAC